MANGIEKIDYVEIGTATLVSGVSIESWGFFDVVKCGRVVIVSFGGLKFSAAHASPFTIATLPWASVNHCWAGLSKESPFMLQIDNGSKGLYVNNVVANTNYHGFLVYFTND